MSRTWIYSDPHFFHHNICKFTNYDGSPVRPWDDAEEMSEWMISEYNKLVHPEDRVYLLGDIAMTRKGLDRSLPRLLGRKVLVRGNHDVDKMSYYSQHVDDIRSYVIKKGFILSHIPIHPSCLGRWDLNIHGHLHNNLVMYGDGIDKRYYNACVERTNFLPILLDDILKGTSIVPNPGR